MKITEKLAVFFAVVSLFTSGAHSQDKRVLLLDEAVSKALASNPRLVAARLEAVAAKLRKEQAFANHFGEINIVGNYNHYERDRILVPMAVDLFKDPALGMSQLPWDRNQSHYGLSFTLPLLAGGAFHEGDSIARLFESSADNISLFTRDETVYNVKSAYRGALALKHALDAAAALRSALEKDNEDYRLRLSLGQVAKVDAQKVEFACEGAKSQYEDISAQYANAMNLLSALLGEEPGENVYELEDISEVPAAPLLNYDEKALVLSRKDFLAQMDATKVAEHKKHLALAAFSPQLVLQGTYMKNSAPSITENLYTREWLVAVKIPLFNGLKRVRAVQESSINLEIAKEKEKAKRLEIETQIANAGQQLRATEALYRSGIAQRELGREIARVEKLKLDQGNGNMEDYLSARAHELQGETYYWRSLYAFQNAVDYFNFVCASQESRN